MSSHSGVTQLFDYDRRVLLVEFVEPSFPLRSGVLGIFESDTTLQSFNASKAR